MRLAHAVAVGTSFVLGLAGAALGEDLEDRVTALERKVEEGGKSALGVLGIETHALVSSAYTYSFNRPDDDTIEARTFTSNDNSIDLTQASLFFSRAKKEDDRLGFGITLDFGEVAKAVGVVSRWDSDFDLVPGVDCASQRSCSSESANSFELREAYLTYELPVGQGITLKAGRFVTLLGYEVIESYNAFNENISRSIMFGYFLPFTHTGLLASTAIGEHVTVDLGIVNGWDDVVDRNDGKTLLAGIGYQPLSNFRMYAAGTYGPEQTDRGDSKRGMVTYYAVYNPIERLTFALDLNYGNESDLLDSESGSCTECRSADWYGMAAYGTVAISEKLSFTLRGEVMDDPDGVRGIDATVWELTPTLDYHVTDHLLARAEYRHDEASKPIFGKEDRYQDGSDTIGVELTYAF